MIAFYLLFALFLFSSDTGTIQLTVQHIRSPKGTIKIAVFNSADSFLKDGEAIQTHSIPVKDTKDLTLTLQPLPYGTTYSIAIYHDVNDNNQLDTNLFGVPKEPYGFSNNTPSKWGAPKYEIARFELKEAEMTTSIKVKKWSEH